MFFWLQVVWRSWCVWLHPKVGARIVHGVGVVSETKRLLQRHLLEKHPRPKILADRWMAKTLNLGFRGNSVSGFFDSAFFHPWEKGNLEIFAFCFAVVQEIANWWWKEYVCIYVVGILILLTWDCKIGFQWFSRVSCAWWQSDRFITDRSAMDFNIANYMLGAKENNCSVDSSLHSPSEVKTLKIFSWRMNVETMYVVVPLSLSNKIVILCFSNELILSFTHTQPASFWNNG